MRCYTKFVCKARGQPGQPFAIFDFFERNNFKREILENQQEITTVTVSVIWARQLVSPQPKLGPVP